MTCGGESALLALLSNNPMRSLPQTNKQCWVLAS